MSDNLDKKKEKLKELLSKLDEVDIDEVKDEFKELLNSISPLEIPQIEQELVNEGRSPKNISKMCDIHVELFKESLENRIDADEFKSGHPLRSLINENKEISNDAEQLNLFLKSLKSNQEDDFSSFLTDYINLVDKLLKIDRTHYERLEMLVFPHIERKGISAVPRVLWKKHQENMNYLKNLKNQLGNLRDESTDKKDILKKVEDISNNASSNLLNMVFREENILYPTLKELLKPGEWKAIRSEEEKIGFYGDFSPRDEWSYDGELIFPNEISEDIDEKTVEELPEDLKNVIGDKVPEMISFGKRDEDDISLDSGYLSNKELNELFKSLPVDLTYIGSDGRVKFFSDKNRVFNRTRSIIGRPVKFCHPPSSVDIVQEIIEKFESGEEDDVDFWLKMGDNFIYISYHAIRDGKEFLGAVEVTQEISKFKEIEGSKTLLDW